LPPPFYDSPQVNFHQHSKKTKAREREIKKQIKKRRKVLNHTVEGEQGGGNADSEEVGG